MSVFLRYEAILEAHRRNGYDQSHAVCDFVWVTTTLRRNPTMFAQLREEHALLDADVAKNAAMELVVRAVRNRALRAETFSEEGRRDGHGRR